MSPKQHPHVAALNKWCLKIDGLKILHRWLGYNASHFVVLGDGHLYFFRVFGQGDVSQDARISVYDHTDPRLLDGLELFYVDPSFRAKSN